MRATAYLAGPIFGCTDAEAMQWRDVATQWLAEHGIAVKNPMSRDYRGAEHSNVDDIVHGDKHDISASDILLAHCLKPSVGTSMEIMYAWQAGLDVALVLPPAAAVSPWLTYHSDFITNDLFAALDWVNDGRR